MKNHFTLLELLVVIAIITVLIAFFLPAMSRAKGFALRTQCASNSRQLAMAFISYASDNGGAMVYGRQADHWNQSGKNWAYDLLPYADDDIFGCPAATTTGIYNWKPLAAGDKAITLVLNQLLAGANPGDLDYVTQIKDPSRINITCEYGYIANRAGTGYYWVNWGFPTANPDWMIPHIDKTYVCPITDGHVEILTWSVLKTKRIYYYDPR